MENYDVLIVGASTSGCWFAYQMAKRGHSVLVVEKELPEKVSRAYDIFHMSKAEIDEFDLQLPEEGDPVREFAFGSSPMWSPYGNYPKQGADFPTVGFHKHDYIMLMAERARQAGAKILYGAPFKDLLFDEQGKVVGAIYQGVDGSEQKAYAKIVADCSGIPAVARTKLPATSVVDNQKTGANDILYVVLYYINYVDKSVDPRSLDGFFMQYKSWSAPAGGGYDAILGIGAGHSFAYAEEVFKSQFLKNVKRPEFTVGKIERGLTPYKRSLYSFVDDGFIAIGDSACLTKPTSGEGCTSSLVLGKIAVEVISDLLKSGSPLTKENMWSINSRYMKAQGKDFDSLRPLLYGLIAISFDEAEYFFKNDVLFSQKILAGATNGIQLDNSDISAIIKGILKGIFTGKIKISTVSRVLKGLSQSSKIGKLYDNYPASPADFAEWKKKTDAVWKKIGSVMDTCDPEILKRVNK